MPKRRVDQKFEIEPIILTDSFFTDDVFLMCTYEPEIICYGSIFDLIGIFGLIAFLVLFLMMTFCGLFGMCVRPKLRKIAGKTQKHNNNDDGKSKDKMRK
ncbi:unnamed protein product [Caenorhabditis angaria]|uniref:Uncharacterized protein n=1 Tax=Caenorhabditis angaria TaxID=860376 RepID=A0A9P1MW32_9PELO|nr:unnamed protein product [Caenorhabditis angaria]